jgi:Gpi18-like mannosyltransferase
VRWTVAPSVVISPARCVKATAPAVLLALGALFAALLAFALPRIARFDFDQPPRVFAFSRFSGTERLPDGRPFRWSRPTATLTVPNPGVGVLRWQLVLAAGPRPTVPLTLTVGGYALPPIAVAPEPRVYTFLAPQHKQGSAVTLALAAPSARDSEANRALGVAVGPLVFNTLGRALPPGLFVLALVLASLGAYALTRQAGLPLFVALALILGVQLLYALAEALWLWRWGLSPRLLALLGFGALAAVAVERWLLPREDKQINRQANGSGRKQNEYRLPGQRATRNAQRIVAPWLPFALLTVLVLITRLPLLGLSDPSGDINTAADRAVLLSNEGLSQAYRRGNDYLALRQYLLLGLGTLAQTLGLSLDEPLSYRAAALLKTPQVLADLAVVLLVYQVARRWRSQRGALGLSALYALTPPIWMNAAWWGQVDSILILGMLLALVLLGPTMPNQQTLAISNNAQRAAWSWLAWGLALGVKAQPVLLLPALAAATLRLQRARGLLIGACTALAALVLGALPLIWAGQMAGLLTAYEGAVGRYPYSSVSAYNLWSLLHGVRGMRDDVPAALGLTPLQWGLLLLTAVCLVVVIALLRRADLPIRFTAGAALALAFFALTTQMHQRYLVFAFALLVLCAAHTPRLVPVYALLAVSATINVFGTLPFLPSLYEAINASPLPTLAALVNLGVLGVLVIYVLQQAWGEAKATQWHGDKATR